MITNQILLNTIEGLKGIWQRVDFCIFDTEEKVLAPVRSRTARCLRVSPVICGITGRQSGDPRLSVL